MCRLPIRWTMGAYGQAGVAVATLAEFAFFGPTAWMPTCPTHCLSPGSLSLALVLSPYWAAVHLSFSNFDDTTFVFTRHWAQSNTFIITYVLVAYTEYLASSL